LPASQAPPAHGNQHLRKLAQTQAQKMINPGTNRHQDGPLNNTI
jgi:hypothetical protein